MSCKWTAVFAGVVAAGMIGCGGPEETILIDGSSTVAPISQAVSEEFGGVEPHLRTQVATSGTGGGFSRFCIGETDINDASRPIKPSEAALAAKSGIAYIELPVAYDGISVVVNPKNDFVDYLTVDELKRIWEPESAVKQWSDVRVGWPEEEIKLYAPGTASGTFDYFTKAICGEEGASRSDCQFSENDNTLVRGVAGDPYGLGYFGYAYYAENQEQLRVVPIQVGEGEPVTPSEETIRTATYQPLSRPIFIYVSAKAAERPAVQKYVKFYLTEVKSIAGQVGYVPLTDEVYALALERFAQRVTGSMFGEGAQIGVKLEDLLRSIGEEPEA